eukprot:CAMPEP_0175052192 /NCGR_PEP_ID=MMETSP0052_2-20121109/8224_1 /TAXON_ID=51329 ORGANISM="Polytomella parva, Strain SAG 63-3" /NCGR_SAMPLE_ID=MMETSP0052_2 /ASSEMBLY_ACC=CAM_ASM_000194 /LENGTH=399 /DNA_ID=CAMNT_0016316571 /DNA_START=276 /DNA_END=1472 /DNA_ORIENTATION=-
MASAPSSVLKEGVAMTSPEDEVNNGPPVKPLAMSHTSSLSIPLTTPSIPLTTPSSPLTSSSLPLTSPSPLPTASPLSPSPTFPPPPPPPPPMPDFIPLQGAQRIKTFDPTSSPFSCSSPGTSLTAPVPKVDQEEGGGGANPELTDRKIGRAIARHRSADDHGMMMHNIAVKEGVTTDMHRNALQHHHHHPNVLRHSADISLSYDVDRVANNNHTSTSAATTTTATATRMLADKNTEYHSDRSVLKEGHNVVSHHHLMFNGSNDASNLNISLSSPLMLPSTSAVDFIPSEEMERSEKDGKSGSGVLIRIGLDEPSRDLSFVRSSALDPGKMGVNDKALQQRDDHVPYPASLKLEITSKASLSVLEVVEILSSSNPGQLDSDGGSLSRAKPVKDAPASEGR